MNRKSKVKSLICLSMAAVASVGASFALLSSRRVTADDVSLVTAAGGAITYSAADFKVEEDYAPFVMSAGNTDNGSDWLDINGTTKMRLDEGKRGLYLESKKTGKDAIGSKFEITNTLQGTFSMDFRVFSEVSALTRYNGVCTPSDYQLPYTSDEYNPYMDLRRMGIRVSSVSNPDISFVVYVYAGQSWNYMTAIARVAIDGEEYNEKGAPGYGCMHNMNNKGEYTNVSGGGSGYATAIYGSTFSNVTADRVRFQQSYSTTIEFDPETMCVYAVGKILKNNRYSEKRLLIRNLDSNEIAETGQVKTGNGLQTIAADEGYFIDGYRTEIFIDDMTANDTKLTVATPHDAVNTDNTLYGAAYAKPLSETEYAAGAAAKKYADGYERTAKMVIYSINGQSLEKTEGWDVEENADNAVLDFSSAKGKTQISNPFGNKTWSVNYSEQIKYEGENGSTVFTAGEEKYDPENTMRAPIYVSFEKPYFNYVGASSKIRGYIYVKDEALNNPDYTLRLKHKGSSGKEWNDVLTGDELSGINEELGKKLLINQKLLPNQWNEILIDFGKIPEQVKMRAEGSDERTLRYKYSGAGFRVSEFGLEISGGFEEGKLGDGKGIDKNDSFCFSSFKQVQADVENKNLSNGSIRLVAKATGSAAEGNSFGLNPQTFLDENGVFRVHYTAAAARMATSGGAGTAEAGALSQYTYNPGLGDNDYEIDPWSDVRELAFTFRSTIDPTQAFTVYTVSRSRQRKAVGLRVAVEGEAYRNDATNPGYADKKDHVQNSTHTSASGSFGLFNNTGDTSYNSYNGMYIKLKVDFSDTIKVYTYNYGEALVRDLTKEYGVGLNTLKASDFADGAFTVEVKVTSMNTDWNRGRNTAHVINNAASKRTAVNMGYIRETEEEDYILDAPYDRYAVIDIFAVEETKNQKLDKSAVFVPDKTGYVVTREWLNWDSLQDIPYGNLSGPDASVTLSGISISDLFGKKRMFNGEFSYTSDNGDSGVVEIENGVGKFVPSGLGTYTFSYVYEDGFVKTKTIKVCNTFTYIIKDIVYTGAVTEECIRLADFTEKALKNADGMTFIGWEINGKLYSSDYVLPVESDTTVKARYLDLAMMDGASIRMSLKSPGLRFTALMSKSEYEDLIKELGNVDLVYEIESFAGEHKTENKEITDLTTTNLLGDTSGETYYLYASVTGLTENEYGKEFRARVKISFVAEDGKEVSYYAYHSSDESDMWRSIRSVAANALASGDIFTDSETKVYRGFADVGMQKTLRMDARTKAHLQNIVIDDEGKYLYGSYGYHIIKVEIETGKTSAVHMWNDANSHGGAVAYHNGYVYMSIIRNMTYDALTEDIQTLPNVYLARVRADSFPDERATTNTIKTPFKSAAEAEVEVAYVGAPIVALSSQAYEKNGEKAWPVGGKYGVTNFMDGITFGPKMGGQDDDKTYFTIALETTCKSVSFYEFADGSKISTASRGDANNIVFGQIDAADIDNWGWVSMQKFLDNHKETDGHKLLTAIPAVAATKEFDNIAFFECGNLDWGLQGLTYDKYLDVYLCASYGGADDDGLGGGTEYTGFSTFAVDPRSAETESVVPGTNDNGYVLKAKYGRMGNKGVVGMNQYWATAIASVGNGYYYTYYRQGNNPENNGFAYDIVRLEKFCLTPNTCFSVPKEGSMMKPV